MYIHLDKLRQHDPALHGLVADKAERDSGICEVEPTDFQFNIMQRLITFAKAQKDMPMPAKNMSELEAEQKQDIQRRVNKALAIQRVNDYVRDAGLVESDANGKLIREWIENAGGWTPKLVDAAIVALNNQLEWRTEPVPEPEKPEKPEVLQPWQLPIDADEYLMKKASTKALLDLNQRRRKATGQMILGKNAQINRHGTIF